MANSHCRKTLTNRHFSGFCWIGVLHTFLWLKHIQMVLNCLGIDVLLSGLLVQCELALKSVNRLLF